VRVTNMAGIDLNTFIFDYDLTFVALLMNADGTIYHTYGGRDWRAAATHLDGGSFRQALVKGLRTHKSYRPSTKRLARPAAVTVEELPAMKRRIAAGNRPTCYHCHTINDMRTEELMRQGVWKREMLWRWPDPIQLGITLHGQTLVTSIAKDAPLGRAELSPGEKIVRVGAMEVSTFGDIQRALRALPDAGGDFILETRVSFATVEVPFHLPPGWKAASPEVFAWRASKWTLSPKPGFGGKQLDPEALRKAGLPEDTFAFRVGYLVTWGPNAHTGRNAAKAGLRKGDIVVAVAKKDDFKSVEHFHAWFRLTQRSGTEVPVEYIRKGERKTLQLPVVD
jgi:hypothetical protein